MAVDLTKLREPVFVNADYNTIIKELIDKFEKEKGEKLYPAQIERLLLDVVAYEANVLGIFINETGKQNLLAYATGSNLDHIGSIVGIERLPGLKAVSTLRVELKSPLTYNYTIPKGTRVRPVGSELIFVTVKNATIPAGSLFTDVDIECTEIGEKGNGFMKNTVTLLMDPLKEVSKVYNLYVTAGGSDHESDDDFRERIRLAGDKYSTAGSYSGYEYWVRSAYSEIEAVNIDSPAPGTVNIYILLKNGIMPSRDVLDYVREKINAQTIRPLTDKVNILAPEKVVYDINVTVDILKEYEDLQETIRENIYNALISYGKNLQTQIGKDIVADDVIAICQNIEGVYKTHIASPADTAISKNQVAVYNAVLVYIGEVVNG